MTLAKSRSRIGKLALILLLVELLARPSIGSTAHTDTLLVFDEAAHRLLPVDPTTLAAEPGATGIALGRWVGAWDIALSADGSTLVTLDRVRPTVVTVRDGRTGAERARFDAAAQVDSPRLSPDGKRLLLNVSNSARGWALYDTTTGKLVSKFVSPEGWVDPAGVTPDLTRLFYLTIPSNTAQPTAGMSDLAPELVAVDLTTGREIGRVLLPDILSGIEPTAAPPTNGGETPYHSITPGLAVSPDGRRIAVVRADRSAFTLVDAESLTIERTVAIAERESLTRRILTWLLILPRSAAAKMGTGDVVYAAFSPDGSRLFVWGYHDTPEIEQERVVATGTGLMAIDVENGEIIAQGPDDQLIERLATSPDGGSLYVTGPTLGKRLSAWTSNSKVEEFESTFFLNRLDADSLELLASREFSHGPWITVIE